MVSKVVQCRLDEEQIEILESLKSITGNATGSKAMIYAMNHYQTHFEEIAALNSDLDKADKQIKVLREKLHGLGNLCTEILKITR